MTRAKPAAYALVGAVGFSVVAWAAHVATTLTVDYIEPYYDWQPPRVYVAVEPTVVTLEVPTPTWGTVAVVFLAWLLGVAYGIYLVERRYGHLQTSLVAFLRRRFA